MARRPWPKSYLNWRRGTRAFIVLITLLTVLIAALIRHNADHHTPTSVTTPSTTSLRTPTP